MAKAKARVTAKIKKKFWFPILAPKVFNNMKIGEIYLGDANQALGRVFWFGLKEITENMRDQNVYLNFKIKTFTNNSLTTDLIGYKLTPTAIKKMIRRRNDRSDDSFVIKTSDNKKIRIKTLILTAHSTKNSINTRLKRHMIEKITRDISKINFGNLLDKLIAHRIQIEMKKFLTKLYPVKIFAVKYMCLEKEKLYGKEEDVTEEVVEEIKEEAKEEKKEVKKETVKEVVKEPSNESEKGLEKQDVSQRVEEKIVEKTVEKVVEKVEKLPEEKAEKAAEAVEE